MPDVTSQGPAARSDSLRLADLLASLSLVADLGFGFPPGEAMHSCLIATTLARRAGLPAADVSDVFYTALLEHIGCIGFAHETAVVYRDEFVMNLAGIRENPADPKDPFVNFLPAVTRGRPLGERIRVLAYSVTQGSRFGTRYIAATCDVGRSTARRLGLSAGVQRALNEVFEGWNGKGGVHGLRGEDIALAGRFARAGMLAARFDALGGAELAVAAVRERAGFILDPSIALAFASDADEILGSLRDGDPYDAILDAEPEPVRSVSRSRLSDLAAVFGDVVDLKSPQMTGHSGSVARLARDAGQRLGLDPREVDRLHAAGLLHDLGRVGVSDSIWERPGQLTGPEWEQVRLHAYHSERILARSTVLRPMARIVGMHHERLDGSGYHRGSQAREVPLAARILGAADAYVGMTQDRAYRPAMAPEAAADTLRDEIAAGRLDHDAAGAVLEAAGMPRPRARGAAPAGLSAREVEVLRAVSRGATNPEIGRRFAISPRTAEHHVQHVYAKIGVSSRAAAAIFAMEHGLLD
jgi:HD-GYP domain-containing protein (c-di-GMP phosphodiesterase class II)/DNA-binding CsgD family transcriptional regulator